MKLGLHMPAMSWDGGPARFRATLGEIATAAEDAGFDAIDVADHVWQHPIMGGPYEPQLEAYVARAIDPSSAPSFDVPGDK